MSKGRINKRYNIVKIPCSTYYYYEKQFKENKPDKYAVIKSEIRRIYDEKQKVVTAIE